MQGGNKLTQADLYHLAEKVLKELIDAGDIEQNGQKVFAGTPRSAAKEYFEIRVRDLSDPSSPAELEEDLQEGLPTLSSERRDTLAREPRLITDSELSIWLEFSGVSELLFELGYLFPLTDNEFGPCAILGSRGHYPQPDYEVLLVAQSPAEADKLWECDWL